MGAANTVNAPNIMACSGVITGATATGTIKGGRMTRQGAGAYTIIPDQGVGGLDANNNPACIILATIVGAVAQFVNISGGNFGGGPNNSYSLLTSSQAGAAVDANFNFMMLQISP